MNEVEKLIRQRTMNMFSDFFYQNISSEILSLSMDKKEGYVYIIKNGKESNLFKIGCCYDLDNRFSAYTTGFENKVFVVGYIKCFEYFMIEKEIHNDFKFKRKKGEWFQLSFEDLLNIKESYDFKLINSYLTKGVKIVDMKENLESDSKIFEFASNLIEGEVYNASELFKQYKLWNDAEDISNVNWFGRELSKAIYLTGRKKVTSTNGGVRTFYLK